MNEEIKRRVVLETAHSFGTGWACVAAWKDGELHFAHCDYSNNGDISYGFDIDQPAKPLTWLVKDKFESDESAFAHYTENLNMKIARNTDAIESEGGSLDLSMIVSEQDRPMLTLALLSDHCQGKHAMNCIRSLLVEAEIGSTRFN